nr:head-tail adaptor protein [Rhodovulum sp. ES.010]
MGGAASWGSYAPADDGFTTAAGEFVAYGAPVWAGKRDIADGERWRAGEVAAHVTTRFTVRSTAFTRNITPADRLVCEGVSYGITGIKEIGRRQWLEITAGARAD